MTALALDVRELTFEEMDMVSGGHADAESFWQGVAVAVLVGAAFAAPVVVIGVIAVAVVVAGATPAN